MRSSSKALIALALLGGVLLLYDCVPTTRWDGSFPLTVTLEPAEPETISAVRAVALARPEWAEEVQLDPESAGARLKPIERPLEPFVVDVPCSGGASGFGREVHYVQFRALLLRLRYRSGAEEWKLVAIPDGRRSRSITVTIP